MITGVGLVLMADARSTKISTWSRIKLIRPDKTTLETVITHIGFENGDIAVGKNLTKQDVPIGTEVWLIE